MEKTFHFFFVDIKGKACVTNLWCDVLMLVQKPNLTAGNMINRFSCRDKYTWYKINSL